MLDYSIIFFTSSISLIIILLWLITFIGNFFFNKKYNSNKFDSYECGFKSFTDLKLNLSIGNYIVIVFIVLYDIELIFTIPFLLFYDSYLNFDITHIYFLFISILITFLIDIIDDLISWNF